MRAPAGAQSAAATAFDFTVRRIGCTRTDASYPYDTAQHSLGRNRDSAPRCLGVQCVQRDGTPHEADTEDGANGGAVGGNVEAKTVRAGLQQEVSDSATKNVQ